jgi:type I restriction enzyme S subunit
LRRQQPLSPISKSDEVFGIHDNWKWVKIGNLAISTDYGISQKSENIIIGVPVLKMGDIQGGRVQLSHQHKVPRDIDDLPALFLKKFDLLYNRTNSAELVGKTGIYLGESEKYTFASYLIRLRLAIEFTNPHFVNLAMNAPFFRETQVVPHLKQQCGQANVNGTKLKNMLIPLPPLAEQHRIVAKVDELMALCDELEARLTDTAAARRQLLEATLSEAIAV